MIGICSMKKTLPKRYFSSIFIISFSVVYLLWGTGKFAPWKSPHFDLFLFISSAIFGCTLLYIQEESGKKIVWAWKGIVLVALILIYSFCCPHVESTWGRAAHELTVVFLVFLISFFLFHKYCESEEIRIFHKILWGLAALVLISSALHALALLHLEPSTYVTARKHTVSFAMDALNYALNAYFFFPLLVLMVAGIFFLNENVFRQLYIMPVVFIPSLAVALYQGYVNIQFLNFPFFYLNRVSGLGYDGNSFAFCLYLLFPFAILNIIIFQEPWKKLFFLLLAVVIVWCIFLSGSRTAFFGAVLFLCMLPWLCLWVRPDFPRKVRIYIIMIAVFPVLLAIGGTAFVVHRGGGSSLELLNRLFSSYKDFEKGGVQEVLRTSSRTHLWIQAYRLTMESPLSGWGPGGFQRNLDNVRFRNNEDPKYDYVDFAANGYLQFTSDMGIPWTSYWVALIMLPLWMVFRVRKKIRNQDERWAAAISFVTVCIMLLLLLTGPWIIVGLDVLWVFAVYLGFLAATGLKYGYVFDRRKIKWASVAFVFLLGMFLLRTYDHSFGFSGYKALQEKAWWPLRYDRNCYAVEDWSGKKCRWCGREAFLRIPIPREIPSNIVLNVLVCHPDITERPVTFRYGGKNGPEHTLRIHEATWKRLVIPVTEEYLAILRSPQKKDMLYFIVSLDVSRTWSPRKFGLSDDSRELGVAVVLPDRENSANGS